MIRYFAALLIILFTQNILSQMVVTIERWDRENQIVERPRPINTIYSVQALEVEADIKDHLAEVSVIQEIKNVNNHALDAQILFPLPAKSVIQNFILMMDGEEITGEIMTKEEARSIYESIVRRRRDPALMEYADYGLFKTSVFPIAVGQTRRVTIRYTVLCDKRHGTMQFEYPIGTQKFSSQPIPKVTVTARVRAKEDIKAVYCPMPNAEIKKVNERFTTVKYEVKNQLPSTNFKLNYTMDNKDVGAGLYSYMNDKGEGYFMLLASPKVEVKQTETIQKNLIFVLDKSGSMGGKKITQAKEALKFVLSNLNDGDQFNMITYDDRVELYNDKILSYSSKTSKEALAFAETINSGGGTNIDGALTEALAALPDNNNPSYIIFLTDGLPTAGITNESAIVQNVAKNNTSNARIFCFGVGDDVNARLLDRLSTDNGGLAEYVRPNENVESSVASLYNSISAPVMTDISIAYNGLKVSETYPIKIPDLFKDSQLPIYGRYSKAGTTTILMKGKINGKERIFEFPATFQGKEDGRQHDYVEKLWAGKRVAHILTMIDQNGQNKEMVDELVSLSKKYGILTPYTSFLAKENVDITNNKAIRATSSSNLKRLESEVSGSAANEMRAFKNTLALDDVAEESFAGPGAETVDFEGNVRQVNTVYKMGNKTFFNKSGKWVDGSIDSELSGAKEVVKFSEEYFKITKSWDAEHLKCLSIKEDFYIKVGSTIYHFVDKK